MFQSAGDYDITLVVANADGTDTLTQEAYIDIGGTRPLLILTLDNLNNCSALANCGNGNCTVGSGWNNVPNGIEDDIDWRIHSGTTPSPNTGPSFDHTTGTAQGKYLYLESTGCRGKTAILESDCIDLTDGYAPYFEFAYHMYGSNVGPLRVDVYTGNTWFNDIIPLTINNQGDNWYTKHVDLSAYIGTVIKLRIRALTSGISSYSDIAIDDLKVIDVLDYNIRMRSIDYPKQTLCPGSSPPIVSIVNDGLETLNQLTFHYGISGDSIYTHTVTGLNLAAFDSLTLSLPAINLTTGGDFIVYTSQPNGISDEDPTQDTLTNFLNLVSTNAAPPILVDFQTGGFPSDWTFYNDDNSYTWTLTSGHTHADCSSGNTNSAIFMNNLYYFGSGQEDIVESPVIDLTNTSNPYLSFDYAYATYPNNNVDSFRVEILPCQNIAETLWGASGSSLQTTLSDTAAVFRPSCSQWANIRLDLSAYAGSQVVLRFVAVNGFGNSLYLDNITVDDSLVCKRDVYESNDIFTDAQPLSPIGVLQNASICPAQDIDYYSFQLTDERPNVRVRLHDLPADYALEFYDISQSLLGSSDTTDQSEEIITFDDLSAGTYFLKVYGVNDAASSIPYQLQVHTRSMPFLSTPSTSTRTNIPSAIAESNIRVFPNPTKDHLSITLNSTTESPLKITLQNLTGQTLIEQSNTTTIGDNTYNLSLQTLPQGIYMIKIEHNSHTSIRKVIRE